MQKNAKIFEIILSGDLKAYQSAITNVDIDQTDENGMSLLHIAIASRQPEIALDLIKRSIDVNLQDKNRQTGLHYIGFYLFLDVARSMLEHGADVDLQDKYGNNPLWYAVVHPHGQYELTQLFMDYGSNPEMVNKVGKTPMSAAVQRNNQRMIDILQGKKAE